MRFAILVLAGVLALGACTKRGDKSGPEEKGEFQKAVEALPSLQENCMQVNKAYEQLCSSDKSAGQCLLKDKAAMNKAIELLKQTSGLPENALVLWKKFIAMDKPTRSDVIGAFSLMGQNCLNMVQLRIWTSVVWSLEKMGSATEKTVGLQMMKAKFASEASNRPTLLDISVDTVHLNRLVGAGLIKVSDAAKTELENLQHDVREFREGLMTEYQEVVTGPQSSIEGDDAKATEMKTKFDPAKVHALFKKEAEKVQAYREKLKAWIDKNWKS